MLHEPCLRKCDGNPCWKRTVIATEAFVPEGYLIDTKTGQTLAWTTPSGDRNQRQVDLWFDAQAGQGYILRVTSLKPRRTGDYTVSVHAPLEEGIQ